MSNTSKIEIRTSIPEGSTRTCYALFLIEPGCPEKCLARHGSMKGAKKDREGFYAEYKAMDYTFA